MMWPNVEEIVEVTLSNRERMLRHQDSNFRYAPGAHDRVSNAVHGARLQIVRNEQFIDVMQKAIEWEERVMTRAMSESAWSMWQEAA